MNHKELTITPIHAWKPEYQADRDKLIAELTELIERDMLYRWKRTAKFPGRGKLELPDTFTSINNWLKIKIGNTCGGMSQLHIFWLILNDQATATDEDKEVIEQVKTTIQTNLISCLFTQPYDTN